MSDYWGNCTIKCLVAVKDDVHLVFGVDSNDRQFDDLMSDKKVICYIFNLLTRGPIEFSYKNYSNGCIARNLTPGEHDEFDEAALDYFNIRLGTPDRFFMFIRGLDVFEEGIMEMLLTEEALDLYRERIKPFEDEFRLRKSSIDKKYDEAKHYISELSKKDMERAESRLNAADLHARRNNEMWCEYNSNTDEWGSNWGTIPKPDIPRGHEIIDRAKREYDNNISRIGRNAEESDKKNINKRDIEIKRMAQILNRQKKEIWCKLFFDEKNRIPVWRNSYIAREALVIKGKRRVDVDSVDSFELGEFKDKISFSIKGIS